MRTLVYDPYLAALGGGELYILMLAQELASQGEVTFLVPEEGLIAGLKERFGLDLAGINWQVGRVTTGEVSRLSARYECFLCTTLANPPQNRARRGILIIQFPFGPRPPRRVAESYHLILCYSHYSREWIQRRWGLTPEILYPAPPEGPLPVKEKKDLILSVGRLQVGLNTKCLPVLMRTFSAYIRDKMPSWEYYVIGGRGRSHEDCSYYQTLSRLAAECGVHLCSDLPRQELLELLAAAKVYWHGTGFTHPNQPESAEHFGISIVEALAAKAVPLVYPVGGPAEIVADGVTGFFWSTPQQLAEKTILLARDHRLRARLAQEGCRAATRYSQSRLRSKFRHLLGRINQ
ncbi:MAG: glycosyltransferase family 4 protein [Firmicutes bacterium]|nr:glycosyltransferase family 4 protein [Bacillota bacterium]